MIYIGADHRGFELKEKLKKYLAELGYEVEDCGAFLYNKDDDYPDFISKVAQKVSEDPENNKGIVLGMTGQGEAVTANKFKNVRAAVFYGPSFSAAFTGITSWILLVERMYNSHLKKIIQLSREHNDANILSLGASFFGEPAIKFFVKLWLETKFSGEERHMRRINKIKEIENVRNNSIN